MNADLLLVRPVSGWRAAGALLAVVVALTSIDVWTYKDCLGDFFHFDDFWVLAAAARLQPHSLSQLWRIFEPIHGFLLYRPLSTVLYFFSLREAFGYDPVGYHATQIVFQILNGVLVYAIAGRVLRSRSLAGAAALIYATAPGHAIAACWMALFTMTGTAFLYFLAVWVWLRSEPASGRWRVPLTLLLFCLALLASEHAVGLPLTLTAASLLLAPPGDWRRRVGELAPFYVIGGAYVAAKLYYTRYGLAAAFPDPAARAYAEAGYHLSLEPLSMLRHLGRYTTFAVDLLYDRVPSDTGALVLGGCVALVAALATILVGSGRWSTRPLRGAVFGLDVFIIGLVPVVALPAHLYSYYIGIAALGMALAIVGAAGALPRCARLAPWALVVLFVAVHLSVTAVSVRESEEFRFLRGFSGSAARWLYTLGQRATGPGVEEVVLPETGVTDLVFNVGKAHQLFLCAGYRVKTVKDITAVEPAKSRLIVPQADPFPRVSSLRGRWSWLRPCSEPPSGG